MVPVAHLFCVRWRGGRGCLKRHPRNDVRVVKRPPASEDEGGVAAQGQAVSEHTAPGEGEGVYVGVTDGRWYP